MVIFNDDASFAVKYLKESVRQVDENKVTPDALKIWLELSRDPANYKVNNIQKKIGLQLGANAGDFVYYYKSDNLNGVSLNPQDISVGNTMASGKRRSRDIKLRSKYTRTRALFRE